MSKRVIQISGSKGGCGKSLLTWLMAIKHSNATILDLDDATKTTSKQLAFMRPTLVSFLDPVTQRIDRGAFNSFFESVSESKKDFFLADLGASVAEQLPKYFAMNGIDNIVEILTKSDIQLEIVCVIGGGNIFRQTMEYASELFEATQGKLKVTLAHNGFYPLSSDQNEVLQEFAKENHVQLISFDLVKDKGEMAMRTVENVLKEGKGIAGLSPFSAIYFKKALEELSL
jgi:hypothetical protein